MVESEIETLIVDAEPDDVPFIAKCVLASVDLYDFINDESVEKCVAEKVCGEDGTLYSYKNARIAVIGGKPVGCLVSYDGAVYHEARKRTFKIFADAGRPMDDTEYETGPGEYYLDCIAILPSYRGRGIGRLLLMDGMEIARSKGFTKAGLIVECSKTALMDYYSSLGFTGDRELFAFGERYLKMTRKL